MHAMIGALAAYEKLVHLWVASEADLEAALFGPAARGGGADCMQKRDSRRLCAVFPQFFHVSRPSRALAGRSLRPAGVSSTGLCARRLLRALAGIARDRGCGRFEWAVLDWNALGDRVLPVAGGDGPARLAHCPRGRDALETMAAGSKARVDRTSCLSGRMGRSPSAYCPCPAYPGLRAPRLARPASPSGSTPAAAACTPRAGAR